MYILKIIESFIKNYKFIIFLYILFTLLAFPLEAIVIPQIYSHFFSILNNKTKKEIFFKYFIVILFVFIIIYVAGFLTSWSENLIIPELNKYIITYIFKNILKKYNNNYEDIELGKLITKLTTIPQYLKEFASDVLIWVFPRLLAILIINIYFLVLNWKLGLLSILTLIILTLVYLYFCKKCSKLSNERHTLFELNNQYTQDKLSNLNTIYSTGNLENEILNYDKYIGSYTTKFKDNLSCLNYSELSINIIIILIFILLNGFSAYLFLKKELSFTNLLAIFITIIYYLPCIDMVKKALPNMMHYYGALSSYDSFLEDLNNVNNFDDKKNKNININYGNININNLIFGYDENILFRNFNLNIKHKEKIAIMGKSGNGKSTLIKLITGYYKISNNMIYIDNIDINNYNLNDLRKQISYVTQNNKLFNMTILENIQYGNNISRNEIITLCKNINIDNIFKNLKNGYDTNVGIEGNNLSGGQRQIIHIIREIFQKNKIVILDEPTSAIDKENTVNIINAILELSKNSTLILITHDDELLKHVDRIVTIDSGKIISEKNNYIS